MRGAARRGEACRYRLTLELTGAPGDGDGVSDTAMRDRCKEAAAVMYTVAPGRIAPGTVVRAGGGDQIDATADKGAEGIKMLRCLFTAGRGFDHIMAMTPDGE